MGVAIVIAIPIAMAAICSETPMRSIMVESTSSDVQSSGPTKP